MKVSIAYAESDSQLWRTVDVDGSATVEDVIQVSGLLDLFSIDLKKQKVGIFGKFVKLDSPVNEGDRVEIYQPITRVLDEDEEDED